MVQLRQLLLDPSVNVEYAGLRTELEARTRELMAAQLQFGAPDSLRAKLDQLQVRCPALRDAGLPRCCAHGAVAFSKRTQCPQG